MVGELKRKKEQMHIYVKKIQYERKREQKETKVKR